MKIELIIPEFEATSSLKTEWEDGFILQSSKTSSGGLIISGNREGLTSLARHILTLAQSTVPPGYHLHYDSWNSLEDGSVEFVLEKL